MIVVPHTDYDPEEHGQYRHNLLNAVGKALLHFRLESAVQDLD